MRVNFDILTELNKSLINNVGGREMSCYFIVQQGVERFLFDESLSENHKNFLVELGVLELTPEEMASQTIVGPFKFNHDGVKETN